jgi:esterase/lipase
VAVLAAALVSATACGADGSTRDRGIAVEPRSVDAKCGETHGAHVAPLWLHATDGQRLYAVSGGSGEVGVVLAPESPPGDVCGWLPYLTTLEQAGLRVIAFDFRGTGDSPTAVTSAGQSAYDRDFAAAIRRLRADGSSKIVVIGASLGGARALTYGHRLDTDAIVSLSGEATLPEYNIDVLPVVSRLRVPLLIVGSRHDAYLPVAIALQLLHRAGSKSKEMFFFPGSWHGWELVEEAPYAARARAAILRWIRSHTRP